MATRVAVVTGGNRGIGLEICRQLASSGVVVVLTARDEEKGSLAVEELQRSGLPDVIFHQLDVADRSSIARLAEFVKTKFGKLDILVGAKLLVALALRDEPGDSGLNFELFDVCEF